MGTANRDEICSEINALLDAASDQSEQANLIAQHIASCPDCGAATDSILQVIARYRELEQDDLPPELELRLLEQLCH